MSCIFKDEYVEAQTFCGKRRESVPDPLYYPKRLLEKPIPPIAAPLAETSTADEEFVHQNSCSSGSSNLLDMTAPEHMPNSSFESPIHPLENVSLGSAALRFSDTSQRDEIHTDPLALSGASLEGDESDDTVPAMPNQSDRDQSLSTTTSSLVEASTSASISAVFAAKEKEFRGRNASSSKSDTSSVSSSSVAAENTPSFASAVETFENVFFQSMLSLSSPSSQQNRSQADPLAPIDASSAVATKTSPDDEQAIASAEIKSEYSFFDMTQEDQYDFVEILSSVPEDNDSEDDCVLLTPLLGVDIKPQQLNEDGMVKRENDELSGDIPFKENVINDVI